jgi:hypothetical protein
VRSTQEEQTLGIPIGPDTSRIISEILAVATELEFQKIIGGKAADGVRNYDDISVGVKDLSEADQYKFAYSQALNWYELQLNQEKTNVTDSRKGLDRLWSSTLSTFSFATGEKAQKASIDHFFSLAFDLAEREPLDNILNYAVKRTTGVNIYKSNWETYAAYLLKTARANGTCIPAIVQILADYNQKEYLLSKQSIKKFILDAITYHAPVSHHSELAWALFLAKALRIKLEVQAIVPIYQTSCSVCALLVLDLESRGLLDGQLDKSHWQKFLTKNHLYSDMWLLAYEADLKGWLIPRDKNFVLKDPWFKEIRRRKVSFYDTRKNVPYIKSKKRSVIIRPEATDISSDYISDPLDDFDDLSMVDDIY